MQVNPAYPRHIRTKECQTRAERRLQSELAVNLALALSHQFSIHGDVLECVKVFKYLGSLLAQDDNDTQAIRKQLWEAQEVWAHVGQVLHGENTTPRVAAKLYKAVIQAVLLYGFETWNLIKLALAWLMGFGVCASYKMARKHQPRRVANVTWVFPKTKYILEECGMHMLAEYIQVC